MRVGNSTPQLSTEGVQASEGVRHSVQIATLKKVLDGQKQEAAEVLKLLEPKGRVLDIRV